MQQVGVLSSCGVQASHCSGLSCQGAIGHSGFSNCGSWALEHGLNELFQFLWGLWDLLPDQGLNLFLSHWQADSLPLSHQRSLQRVLNGFNSLAPSYCKCLPTIFHLLSPVSKETDNSDFGSGYEATDLTNVFFSNSIRKDNQRQFPCLWEGQHYTFTFFFQGSIKSPALCHKIVSSILDHIDLPQESYWPTILIISCK